MPPFHEKYICEVCNWAYHWECLKNTGCYTEKQREEVDGNDNWACLARAYLQGKLVMNKYKKDTLNPLTKNSCRSRSPGNLPGNRKR